MAEPVPDELRPLVEDFRQALRDCEELYRSSAEDCMEFHPNLIKGTPGDFLDRMLDLHRGLLLKIFVDIAFADWKWKPTERLLARELFDSRPDLAGEIVLVPSSGGVFVVRYDGATVWDTAAVGRFPEPKEVREAILAITGRPPTTRPHP